MNLALNREVVRHRHVSVIAWLGFDSRHLHHLTLVPSIS